jgi:hypothetical protein
MCFLCPLLSQLGQFYTCKILLPRILILHNECSGHNNSSKSARAFSGGINGSPEKLYFKVPKGPFLSRWLLVYLINSDRTLNNYETYCKKVSCSQKGQITIKPYSTRK